MKCNTMCLLRKKMIIKHITECSEKWSDYYTCKQREDEENRKGHLTKLQEAVHVNNFRKGFFEKDNHKLRLKLCQAQVQLKLS